MELKQLEYFMAVCRELHFTRAAEKLGIAQPSLSQQIRLLEHEIGTPLFDRVGKRIVMTEAGKTLLHHCYNVFHELSQARAAISEIQGLQRGSLKIGALLTVVNYLLPPTVIGFHQRYPNVELSVLGLRTGDIYNGCCKTNSTWGSYFRPRNTKTWKQSRCTGRIWRSPRLLITPVAKYSAVSLDILKDTECVLLPDTYFLRQLIEDQCRKLDFAPQPVMELTTMESILTMVGKGVGVTILPRSYLDHVDHPHIRTIPITEPVLTTQIGIVYRKNKYMCAASRVFMEQLISTVKNKNLT